MIRRGTILSIICSVETVNMSNHINDVSNWTALVVEDSRELADIVKHLLTTNGAQVHIAFTGESAYELLAELNPTFILLDLKLPDTDGFAVLKKVRNELNVRAPVIAFTARAHVEAKELLEDGFDAFILKPFRMDELVPTLRSILERLTPPPPTSG